MWPDEGSYYFLKVPPPQSTFNLYTFNVSFTYRSESSFNTISTEETKLEQLTDIPYLCKIKIACFIRYTYYVSMFFICTHKSSYYFPEAPTYLTNQQFISLIIGVKLIMLAR